MKLAALLASILPICTIAASQTSPAWQDLSPHHSQFVTVDKNVKLEVLDWGGAGRPVILLAGSGNTAHIYDDFAPKLKSIGHVYAITRRGYGNSTHPAGGYSERQLAADILSVIDALHLQKPVLIGHSMAGEELTRLGAEHSDRLAGLVYMDAISDPKDFPASSPEYMALAKKLPPGMHGGRQQSDDDTKSFPALRNWYTQRMKVPFPESELHNMYEMKPDGSAGEFRTSDEIHKLVGDGAEARDYSQITVPILSFGTLQCVKNPPSNYACIDPPGRKPDYEPRNAEERAAIRAFDDATETYILRWNANLLKAKGGVRIVDIAGANHYVFLSNEIDVVREVKRFVQHLP